MYFSNSWLLINSIAMAYYISIAFGVKCGVFLIVSLLFSLIGIHGASNFVGDRAWSDVYHFDILINVLLNLCGVDRLPCHCVMWLVSLFGAPHGRSVGALTERLCTKRICIYIVSQQRMLDVCDLGFLFVRPLWISFIMLQEFWCAAQWVRNWD